MKRLVVFVSDAMDLNTNKHLRRVLLFAMGVCLVLREGFGHIFDQTKINGAEWFHMCLLFETNLFDIRLDIFVPTGQRSYK